MPKPCHTQTAWMISAAALALLPLPQAAARNPTQRQVMEAPAGDLAISYLNAKIMLQTTTMAEAGMQIVTREGTITKGNAAKFKSSYEQREKFYADAIVQRGYGQLAGSYRVRSADPPCLRSFSTLLAGAAASKIKLLTIVQAGPDLTLSITLDESADGSTRPTAIKLDFIGATAEDALAVVDPMNSDYFLEGKASGKTIAMRARPEVLDAWPRWAAGPTKADLAGCTVVLERLD